MNRQIIPSRRHFVRSVTLGSLAAFSVPGLFADQLTATPRQAEGPFYPDKLPLDTDNDLLILNDAITPAVGEVTYLSGRLLDLRGEPIRGAVIEIWQCDQNGAYLHSATGNAGKRDANFQGFGRFLTGASGEYVFRTIKPVPYTGRAPHIHVKVKARGKDLLTTQCYVKGHPENERDGLYTSLKEPRVRDAVTVDFAPLAGARAGELAARFDIVLGATPEG